MDKKIKEFQNYLQSNRDFSVSGMRKAKEALEEIINKEPKSYEDIEVAVVEKKTGKENMIEICLRFTSEHGYKSLFDGKKYIKDPITRQIEIARYINCGNKKAVKDIAEHFLTSEKTIDRDMLALRDVGVKIFGTTLKIEYETIYDKDEKKHKKYYQSSVNPVFLPLNMTQVYALTTGLLGYIDKDDPLRKCYENLAQEIYSQLSEYGKAIISKNDKTGLFRKNQDYNYIHERDFVKSSENALAYLLKCGRSGHFKFRNPYDIAQEIIEVNGSITKYNNDRYIIVSVGEDKQQEYIISKSDLIESSVINWE